MSCIRVHGVSFAERFKGAQQGYRPRGSTVIIRPSGVLRAGTPALAALCLSAVLRLGLWLYGISMPIAATDGLQARSL